MKILQVNKFYYPRGGADKYFLNLAQAQEATGNQVAIFSMHHPKNIPSPWSKYFVSRISFNHPNLPDKLKTPGRVLYSWEAKKNFANLLKDFQPDIIHLHNIYHQISPAILDVAKKQKIPVVMHLHDYKLICPNHSLFNKGKVCERCRPHKYYECLKNRCLKNSFSASALVMAEMYLHHSILKIYKNGINRFIAPSQFMKDTAIRFGQSADKIQVICNPYSSELVNILVENKPLAKESDYLLYFGRLSQEKGLRTLIRATAITQEHTKIVGDGPDIDNLKKLSAKLKAPVEFLGFKNAKDLLPLLWSAKAVIIPSIWNENMPLSLLEAMNAGKIVIASRIGGIPEIIINGKNGLLFTPGSELDLVAKIRSLTNIDQFALSRVAKETANGFTPEKNLQAVMALYQKVLKKY